MIYNTSTSGGTSGDEKTEITFSVQSKQAILKAVAIKMIY